MGDWLACPDNTESWIGAALIPQAGVALGMALIAGNYLPQIKDTLLTTVIGTTVVFEIAGPIATQIALSQVGEIDRTAGVDSPDA